MSSLYHLENEIKNFEFEIDEQTGEVLNMDALDQLELERDAKIENLGCWIKNMGADIAALKEEEQNLAKRRKSLENKRESVTGYLKQYLSGEKFSTSKVAISYRKSETVEIDNIDLVPAEYIRVKTTSEPDKTELKKAMKAGKEFEGIRLVENKNMSIK